MGIHQRAEDCLELAVEAAGGNKVVGHALRPEMSPGDAGKWLARCLSEHHQQRLNYGQEQLIYRLACQQGEHAGFRAYAESIGYRAEPLDHHAEALALAMRAEKLAQQSADLSAEAMARMRAANINVDALAGDRSAPDAATTPAGQGRAP